MAQRHAYSQPIQTYSLAPHNRNIWPSPTPTANQYKHMAQRRIIETYGHTIAGRRSFVTPSRFFCLSFWPILLSFKSPSTHYSGDLKVLAAKGRPQALETNEPKASFNRYSVGFASGRSLVVHGYC